MDCQAHSAATTPFEFWAMREYGLSLDVVRELERVDERMIRERAIFDAARSTRDSRRGESRLLGTAEQAALRSALGALRAKADRRRENAVCPCGDEDGIATIESLLANGIAPPSARGGITSAQVEYVANEASRGVTDAAQSFALPSQQQYARAVGNRVRKVLTRMIQADAKSSRKRISA